jgi:hypothetical protein
MRSTRCLTCWRRSGRRRPGGTSQLRHELPRSGATTPLWRRSTPPQRVKPVAALVVSRRALLLRMRRDQRRLDINRQPRRRAVQFPEPLPRPRPRVRRAHSNHQHRVGGDPVDRPKRGRVRRHQPEQRLLLADHRQIEHALPTAGEHHRQIPNHPARIMPTSALLEHREPQRQPAREPQPVSYLRQQRAAHDRRPREPRVIKRSCSACSGNRPGFRQRLPRQTSRQAHRHQGEVGVGARPADLPQRSSGRPAREASSPGGGEVTEADLRFALPILDSVTPVAFGATT